MRNLLKVNCFVMAFIFMFGCDDESENFDQDVEFSQKVESLAGDNQTIPEEADLKSAEWRCNNWNVDYYENEKQIGEWNNFKESIEQSEKVQTYQFAEGKFLIKQSSDQTTKSESQLEWDYQRNESGEIAINNISLTAKWDNGLLVLYYNTFDTEAVSEIFNVTLDQTYGTSLQTEAGLLGVGIIIFSDKTLPNFTDAMELESFNLVDNFQSREEMFNLVFNSLEVTSDAYTFVLTDQTNAQTTDKYLITLKDQTIDLANITPERSKVLFEAFLNKNAFTFKGVDVMISKITHEDGSGNSFLVYGTTMDTQEEVIFYYNTESGKEHWNQAPQSNSEMSSYNLVEQFQNREEMFNLIFNSLEVTSDAYTFSLTDQADAQSSEKYPVILKDQVIDLANITPERSKVLFEAFLNKNAFTFKGVDVMIRKITHEDGSGNSFLVYGNTTDTQEEVIFYYNTESGKEHWNQAPQSNSEMSSYNLVEQFQNREEMFNLVFNSLEVTSDAYTFSLTDQADAQSSDKYPVILKDQSIDLVNITPERSKVLFEAFLNKNAFTFKGVDVMIRKITHEDGSGNSFLVYGNTTDTQEEVIFYYNTESGKEHWNQAPQ